MTNSKSWFDVDRRGLLQLLERKGGKGWVFNELIQNALDTSATEILVTLEEIPGVAKARVTIQDNSVEGFADLTHAFTMFAPSIRKAHPDKRGRFCIGEKLVLACFTDAKIISTKGGYRFDAEGRHISRERTDAGTCFQGTMMITREELDQVRVDIRRILPPAHVKLVLSYVHASGMEAQEDIEAAAPTQSFTAKLLTELDDGEGNLRRRQRETRVDLRPASAGAWLYELGIPVVEIEGLWHIDVQQKLPLGLERDSVPASYLARIQALVFNEVVESLPATEMTKPWVKEAVQQQDVVKPEAVAKYLQEVHGSKIVINDPSNQEGVRRAQAEGYKVLYGRSEAPETFAIIRDHNLVRPVSELFPPPRASSNYEVVANPSDNYRRASAFAAALAKKLLKLDIKVRVIDGKALTCLASWGRDEVTPTLTFNQAHLGLDFFANGPEDENVISLLIHEMAHQVGDHLEEKFDDAMSRLGAQIFVLARREPEFFSFEGWYPKGYFKAARGN